MNCRKCGSPLEADAKFCEVCGTPVAEEGAGAFAQQEAAPQQTPFQEQQMEESPFGGPVGETPFGTPTGAPQFGGPMGGTASTGGAMDSFDVNAGFGTKRIRRWFKGNKPKWPVVFTVIGAISWIVALNSHESEGTWYAFLFMAFFGVIWAVTWMTSGTVQEVNDAWRTYVNILSRRGLQKLNLIQEEVNLIEPVVLVGCGEAPNHTFEASKAEAAMRTNIFTMLFRLITGKFKREYDPEEKYRVDSQDYFHSMLLQVSVYMFSEDQVYGYFGNIDISTGLIYKEYTSEVFYEDIDAVKFDQEVIKVYSVRRKRRVNKVIESFVLYLAGCKFKSRVLLEANDQSVVDQQLSGMRNLIRDKKKSISQQKQA